jgi:small subunit ribosomal protein YMR-31
MHATLRVLRQPLIKFLGKRSWPSSARCTCSFEAVLIRLAQPTPHAHPAAPQEFQKRFSDSAASASASASSGKGNTGGNALSEFWEAPERFWRPRVRELEESEIEAVLVRRTDSFECIAHSHTERRGIFTLDGYGNAFYSL